MNCTLCPRHCGATRADTHSLGVCRSTQTAYVTRAAAHIWEEPCLSGKNGSGTIFFAGCNLGCVFCQNAAISRNGQTGTPVDAAGLRQIMERLCATGVHNINLVTPTHFIPTVEQALAAPLPLPVVYNCGGYESVESLRRLEGKVQIYLPDMKYAQSEPAAAYSLAADYPQVAKAAIREMVRQRGACRFDEEGLLQSGVIIRHMILPGHTANTLAVIDWVANTFAPGEVLFSLMAQYTPTPAVKDLPPLHRTVTRREYEKCRDHLFDSGIELGYVQERTAANAGYVPDFDGTGVTE